MANTANTAQTGENTEILKGIEQKMSSMAGLADKLTSSIEGLTTLLSDGNGLFFGNMNMTLRSSVTSSLHDNAVMEEARKQNSDAAKLGGSNLERGQAGFWAAAFTPTPTTMSDSIAGAMKTAFSDTDLLSKMQGLFGVQKQGGDDPTIKSIIRSALNSNTEAALEPGLMNKFAIGRLINKGRDWWADRDLRKEEKATEMDKGIIKREQKKMDRAAAKYRKMKSKGASDEELEKIREEYIGYKNMRDISAKSIAERSNDDLIELGSKPPQAGPNDMMSGLMSVLKGLNANNPSAGLPTAGGTDALGGLKAPVKAAPSPAGDKTSVADKLNAETSLPGAAKEALTEEVGPQAGTNETHSDEESKKSPNQGDPKEFRELQRNLYTKLLPDFCKAGLDFFKKGLSGDLFGGLNGDGLLGKVGKGGLYAAGIAAVGASLVKIGQAATLTKELFNTRKQAQETRDQIHDQGAAAHQKQKKGWNDDLRDAYSELEMAEKALDNTWFFDGEEKKRLEAAKKRVEEEKKKMAEFQKARAAAGIDVTDTKAMNEFKKKYDEEQARKKEELKNAVQGGKQKPAAGNLKDSKDGATASTPGATTAPEKVETAEEQAKRMEEATYTGTKKALLDQDVQKQNETNAKTTGQQIDQSLVGRK